MGMNIYHNHQSQKGGIKEKMNTIRKIRKNAKALSPVVASIILIAVTVAVSIAVAAWMGALVVGQMSTEEVKITNIAFKANYQAINVTLRNTGSTSVTITEIRVGTGDNLLLADVAISPNTQEVADVTLASNWLPGYAYQIKAISSKGNTFVYTATAPAT
jgi:archaeal type IV pilus assembly protein PilA